MKFTLVQLEYAAAVATYKSFSLAAEKCFVTQPTLSMQIQKLEHQLNVQLFDRSKKPVLPTEIGTQIIAQARLILKEAQRIEQLIEATQNEVSGELRLGVIPTIAPYVLPYFIKRFHKKYPKIKLIVEELLTEQIVEKLNQDLLDCGLLVTPLQNKSIKTIPLFYEPFVLYLSPAHRLTPLPHIQIDELDLDNMWLLNEGHCFRAQVLNLCSKKQELSQGRNFEYKSGSLETLQRLVEQQENAHTLLPQLAANQLDSSKNAQVKNFAPPVPVREVSLVTHRSFLKKRLIEALCDEILNIIPPEMQEKEAKKVVGLG